MGTTELLGALAQNVDSETLKMIEDGLAKAIATAADDAKREAEAAAAVKIDDLVEQNNALKQTIDANKDAHLVENITLVTQHQDEIKKLQTLAEAYAAQCVNEAVDKKIIEAREHHAEVVAQYTAQIDHINEAASKYANHVQSELTEQATEYVTKVISEYKTEHEAMFESIAKFNQMNGLVEGIKNLMGAAGFTLDDNTRFDNLQRQVNEAQQQRDALQQQLNETVSRHNREKIFESLTHDMSELQRERLAKLSESIKVTEVNEYTSVLNMLKESITSQNVKGATALNESVDTVPQIQAPVNKTTDVTKTVLSGLI